jgi:arylsulfatase A-like enzyme
MPARRPNILFIPVDDLRPQLSCYGQHQVVSPHIDRFAQSGVIFTRAYCQVPVCGATRASVLTGMRPLRDRFVTFKTMVEEDLPNALTMPQYFREQGYTTVSVGKVFHHTFDTADRSWSQRPWRPTHDPDESWRNYLLPENRAADRSDKDRGPAFECADVDDNAYDDGKIAAQAVSELRRLAGLDEPFFLAAGFLKPHLPFNAPKRYWDYYERDELELADKLHRRTGRQTA